MRRHVRKAFTLVELLIAIGIIALLLSLILPVVNKVTEYGRLAGCASNEHEIYVAISAFSKDKDNRDACPGCVGFVAPGGPGTTPYFGIGQLTTFDDSLTQETLEKTSRSVLLIRGYLTSSKVFHCPEQDAQKGFALGVVNGKANFQYVFNQYFVGDLPCVGPTVTTPSANYYPIYSSAFPTVYAQQQLTPGFGALTFNRAGNPSRCVLITEDGLLTDTTHEVIMNKLTYVHASPVHGIRPPIVSDLPNTHAVAVNCTYLDGHTDRVPVIQSNTGTPEYIVQSDHTGLTR